LLVDRVISEIEVNAVLKDHAVNRVNLLSTISVDSQVIEVSRGRKVSKVKLDPTETQVEPVKTVPTVNQDTEELVVNAVNADQEATLPTLACQVKTVLQVHQVAPV